MSATFSDSASFRSARGGASRRRPHAAAFLCRIAGLAAACLLVGSTPVYSQIAPPTGTVEVRYDGDPRSGSYPLFLFRGTTEFVDFDGDTYMDLVMTGLRTPPEFGEQNAAGYTGVFTHRVRLQVNEGGGFDTLRYYERNFPADLPGLYNNALAVGDYNNDGRPDFALAGRTRTQDGELLSFLVEQVDSLVFAAVNPGWLPIELGSMAWGDYDNNGRVDMLMTGQSAFGIFTALYQNQGGRLFQPVDVGLPNIGFGEAAWGDSDNDGDLDIVLSGARRGGQYVSEVYLNDGGQFNRADVDLPGLAFGHARWIDLNADGLLDIVLSGARLSPFILEGSIYFYLNQGGNTFEGQTVDIPAHFDGDLDLIDWNTDGDVDILASGFLNPLGSRSARLYQNEAGDYGINYTFSHVVDMKYAVGDYDRDHDLDLFVTGYSPEPFGLVPPVATFFETLTSYKNEAPSTPQDLSAFTSAARVDLSWMPSSDDLTPNPSLTYNLRVGTTPGGVDVMSPLADPITGKPLVCGQGNVFHNTAWHLEGLPPGTYFWSVQAVDRNCAASAFAGEGTFTIEGEVTSTEDPETPARAELQEAFPNPFLDQTTLRFVVPQPTRATLQIFDMLGRRVRTLVDGSVAAGTHTVVWKGEDDRGAPLPPGVYVYRFQAGESTRAGSTVLIR